MPTDRVLVYAPSAFVYAYYQRETPVLVSFAGTTVGYSPTMPTAVMTVSGESIGTAVEDALSSGARVWFLGSRFTAADLSLIERALRRGDVLRNEQRIRASLALIEPSS